ncbi:MAG: hypothetical protein JST54_35235 [Deltaproteobacteria bacterium]|nr:hypothetical protein [Deltaproteobacteria bacterium]
MSCTIDARSPLDAALSNSSGAARFDHGHRIAAILASRDASRMRAQQPTLIAEEESERIDERLYLTEMLSKAIDALVRKFVDLRTTAEWKRSEVPQLQAWPSGEDRKGVSLLKTAGRKGR